ncbi:MAG: alpha/beta hydrolase, partial [Ilumatobacteraceae bacterium]
CSIPPSGDPAGAADWWAHLTPEQQRFVIEHQPQLVASLDGVPPEVRYEANRVLIGDLIAEMEASGAPQASIDHLKSFLEPYAGHERQILLFDPTGDGRIAEVFGDISTAKDIAVVVPGIGNSMANYSPENAYQLQHAAPAGTASIMWLGYDTPNGPADLATFTADRAHASAGSLATFTSGLHTVSNAEVTLVAHSYGSVVAAEAAKAGMSVERVVLIGSPGIPADNASVFNGAEVYAINNQLDPIGLSGSHGTNPTDGSFGAHVLPGNAAVVHSSTAGNIASLFNPGAGIAADVANAGFENHSTYFDAGSTSLDSIVGVLDDNRSAPDGMSVQRIHNSDGSAEDVYLSTY